MKSAIDHPEIVFSFGRFRFIPNHKLLLDAGHPVRLGGRALDILHLLVRHPTEEISKADLIAHAWPHVFVDEHNLKVHISSLRKALGDTFPHAKFISTVVGRGYQFVADVRTEHFNPSSIPSGREEFECALPPIRPLVGRQRDIEGIARAVDFAKLVTLAGPGGVGKTSLAIAIAHVRRQAFDGVFFIDLSEINSSAQVPYLIAGCLGISSNSGDVISSLVEHLTSHRILIILDSCEHVLPTVAMLVTQLATAPIVGRILVTSREPLGLPSENVQRVEPLGFPVFAQVQSAADARTFPAIELFASRAEDATGYRFVDADARGIARVCGILEGLPLAIDIVASSLDRVSIEDLVCPGTVDLSTLRHHRDTPHRHQSIKASLDWSYRLLAPEEASMLKLASVFTGSFEWADIVGMAALADYSPYQATVALGGLVAKSLLIVEVVRDQPRYRLPEFAVPYAKRLLQRDALAQAVMHEHDKQILSLLRRAEIGSVSTGDRVPPSRSDQILEASEGLLAGASPQRN